MSTEGEHQSHYNHPKIAKNTSNKLPDAFLQSKVTKKVPINVQKQKIKQQKNQKQQKSQIQKQINDIVKQKNQVIKSDITQKKPRQSRNPFLPIRKLKQQMQKFALQSLALHQLYSIPIPTTVQSVSTQLPYESFITLTIITKKQTTVLKKVLHIPEMKVYFMREQVISIGVDKNQLIEWMKGTNQTGNETGSPNKGNIKQLYWNVPQGYYSLLYQYYEGHLMQTLLSTLSILPLNIIQNIAISYFTNPIGIYNSQLILNVTPTDMPQIFYIPIYEETPPIIMSQKLHEILVEEIEEEDFDRKIIWRLGVILMACFVGEEFVRADLLRVGLPLKACCLFHAVIQVESSLSLLYLSQNNLFQESSLLISFLCHLLSTPHSPTHTRSLSDPKLQKHKFLTHPYHSLLTLTQLFHTISLIDLQDEEQALGQFGSDHKLHKVLEVISMARQNVQVSRAIEFGRANKNVGYIAKELGMKNQWEKVGNCLRQVYTREVK